MILRYLVIIASFSFFVCLSANDNEAENNFQQLFAAFCAENNRLFRLSDALNDEQLAKLQKKAVHGAVDLPTWQEWLVNLPSFLPVFSVLKYYARPHSIEVQTASNINNAKSVASQINMTAQLEFLQRNESFLRQIEADFGVNAEILVAIFSSETRLGQVKPQYQAFAVFSTMILFLEQMSEFNPEFAAKRRERLMNMAYTNLIALLHYVHKYNFNLLDFSSSWAGACGPMQIMPFNFYLARDGDGDNIPDINNIFDSLATAANFLNHRGWKKDDFQLLRTEQNDARLVSLLLQYNASKPYAEGVLNSARLLYKLLLATPDDEKEFP